MLLAVGTGIVVASLAAPGSSTAASGTDRLPDLAMARASDLRMLTTPTGRRLLRFTTMIVNIGAGPFETRAARRSIATTSMPVKQRVYDASGGYHVVSTPTVARYSGDGHDHWHVQGVARYELFAEVSDEPADRHRLRPVRRCPECHGVSSVNSGVTRSRRRWTRTPTKPSGTPWTRPPARSCVCRLLMRHCALDDQSLRRLRVSLSPVCRAGQVV